MGVGGGNVGLSMAISLCLHFYVYSHNIPLSNRNKPTSPKMASNMVIIPLLHTVTLYSSVNSCQVT